MFGLSVSPRENKAYTKNREWDHLVIDLANATVQKTTVIGQMDEYKNEIEQEKLVKPKLFTYPDSQQPIGVFDEDELDNEEALLVLCVCKLEEDENRQDHTAYVWKGFEWELPEDGPDENKYIQECIKKYWGEAEAKSLDIKIVQETATNESEAFMYFFE